MVGELHIGDQVEFWEDEVLFASGCAVDGAELFAPG
jgi:hypothetical protein